jgi:hypothetical protein
MEHGTFSNKNILLGITIVQNSKQVKMSACGDGSIDLNLGRGVVHCMTAL